MREARKSAGRLSLSLSKGGMPGRKGPTNYARFVAFYSGPATRVVSLGRPPGSSLGSVITDFCVRGGRAT